MPENHHYTVGMRRRRRTLRYILSLLAVIGLSITGLAPANAATGVTVKNDGPYSFNAVDFRGSLQPRYVRVGPGQSVWMSDVDQLEVISGTIRNDPKTRYSGRVTGSMVCYGGRGGVVYIDSFALSGRTVTWMFYRQ